LKILILAPVLDLTKPAGATPALWQLFKGFYEEGHELHIIPYWGPAIASLWWKCYPNPNYYKSLFLEKILRATKHKPGKKNLPLIPYLARTFSKPKLQKMSLKILKEEGKFDAILIVNLPHNQTKGIASEIKKQTGLPVIYYDLDAPTSLPSHGGFTFNHYREADLGEYDSIVTPSEGSVDELKELGANRVNVIHFGVDLDVYKPINISKDIDFFFFGNDGRARINNMKMMISEPSKILKEKFVISGTQMDFDLGNAKVLPPISFIEMKKYCCRSKITLNVVRELHAKVKATSTSRPFELAAMKCCVVSAPYDGLEKWFDIGKEMFIASSVKECTEIYKMLLNDNELLEKTANNAYERVKKEHTSIHRVRQFIEVIKNNS